jgi:hypothetical protein
MWDFGIFSGVTWCSFFGGIFYFLYFGRIGATGNFKILEVVVGVRGVRESHVVRGPRVDHGCSGA